MTEAPRTPLRDQLELEGQITDLAKAAYLARLMHDECFTSFETSSTPGNHVFDVKGFKSEVATFALYEVEKRADRLARYFLGEGAS